MRSEAAERIATEIYDAIAQVESQRPVLLPPLRRQAEEMRLRELR
jgi:hypothetical protein